MAQKDILAEKDFKRCADFHGHVCPGLAIGYLATKAALGWLSENRAMDEEMVAILETDACGTDALQVLSGCTAGKGNLVVKDYGKHVYTIVSRRSSKGVRVSLKEGALDLGERHRELIEKIRNGDATPEDREAFWKLHQEKTRELLRTPAQELFQIQPAKVTLPPKAVIEPSVPCELCGEPTMESKRVEKDGKWLCRECFENDILRDDETIL